MDADFHHFAHLLSRKQKKARLRRDGLGYCRANDCERQVARVSASRSPAARAVPYGVTDSRRTKYLVVMTPPEFTMGIGRYLYNQVTLELVA